MLMLDEPAASRTWNRILVRQGLADAYRLSTAPQVADAVLGLHAARLPSPYAIVAARTGDPAVPTSLFTTSVRESLLTVRCMRKTLHALPLPLAAIAHAATLKFRDRDARRAVLNAGHAMATVERKIGHLCELLRDGPLSHRVIESHLASRRDVQVGRLAIKVAWERGTIAYVNSTTFWNREARTFALTSSAYPTLDLSVTRDQAVAKLVTAYFDRYGPATVRDATWWSGLPATEIMTALLTCDRPVIAVATPWSDVPCLMFADQTESSASKATTTGVQFLAHEDTALKAYFQTRRRYLGDLPQQQVFNQIGEALPTIIIDGGVAGTWWWNARTASVEFALVPGEVRRPVRSEVKIRAASLTETLRAAWTSDRPSRHTDQRR